MLTPALLAQCRSFKPGVAYVVRGGVYLALTNRSNAQTSLIASRGPGLCAP
jgi:hypothetical protein